MLNPADFGLKENPFGVVPGAEVEHWAGMPEMKTALADVVSSVRPDDIGASEFVVVYGEYGAGKSHALRYFERDINKRGDGRAIYMSEIAVGAGLSFSALCPGILAQLSGEAINHIVGAVKESVHQGAEQMRREGINVVTPDMVIENKVPQQDREMVKSLHNNGRIPSTGRDDHTATKTMASLFRVMTLPVGNSRPPYGAVYLFLDEVEYAFDTKATLQVPFFSALRVLVNEVTERFGLILSFTAQTAVLEAAVPNFLKERMTRNYIGCEQLSAEGAKKFVRDFLGFVRPPDKASPPHAFYPFSEGAIDAIFDRETVLVPRRILKHMRRVWERSVRAERLKPGGEISRELAEGILASI